MMTVHKEKNTSKTVHGEASICPFNPSAVPVLWSLQACPEMLALPFIVTI